MNDNRGIRIDYLCLKNVVKKLEEQVRKLEFENKTLLKQLKGE